MERYGLPVITPRTSYNIEVDPEKYAGMLRESGWVEDAIRREIAMLMEYRERFKLDEPQVLDATEAALNDPLMAAIDRRRKRRPALDDNESLEASELY